MRSLGDLTGRQLVEAAIARPAEVLAGYAKYLAAADPARRVELLRAAGVAGREQRSLEQSEELLDEAHQLATSLGDTQLVALVELSLSATVLYRGDAMRAVNLIERAIPALPDEEQFGALAQRAGILHRAGRVADALTAFDDAFAARPEEPTMELAELLNNRGILLGFLDRNAEATADVTAALRMFSDVGSERRVVDMTHNLAWLAGRRGDIIEALQLFDEAEAEHLRLGLPTAALMPDRCEVLLSAGLVREALHVAERAAESLGQLGDTADYAEAVIACAQIRLRQRDWHGAADAAARAAEVFEASGRTPWSAHARALVIEATHALAPVGDDALDALATIRDDLVSGDLATAVQDVDLLRARILLAAGRQAEARTIVDGIDVSRLAVHSRPGARAVRASVLVLEGNNRGAWRELRQGLRDLHHVRSSLGAIEMRASLGLHGEDVVRIGLELALGRRQPWRVLAWSELGRARALDFSAVTTTTGHGEATEQVRRLEHEIQHAESGRAASLQSELAQAIADLQRVSRRRRGGTHADRDLAPQAVRAALGERRLIQLVEHRQRMFAVVVDGHRAWLIDTGPAAEWTIAADGLRRCLARALDGRGDERVRQAAHELLECAGQRVDRLLVPLVGDHLDLVLVVTPRLHAAPWGALPSLRGRRFAVAPSTTLWLTAHARPRSLSPTTAAFAGPNLATARTEVTRITHLSQTEVSASLATCADVLAGLGKHDTVHLACHGRFVAENPLLSSLHFADGPLYVYDLEHASQMPQVVVLSACSTALSANSAGEELIGIVASLLSAGTASVVASAVPVPDDNRVVEAMMALHRMLASGADPATALCEMRREAPDIAAAFTCYGAG